MKPVSSDLELGRTGLAEDGVHIDYQSRVFAIIYSSHQDIPSSIQITPRQRLSPGITRRVGENFALTSREKIKSGAYFDKASNCKYMYMSCSREQICSEKWFSREFVNSARQSQLVWYLIKSSRFEFRNIYFRASLCTKKN